MGASRRLKLTILDRYPSQRAFLADLQRGSSPIILSESRLSKLVTGHLQPTPEERRAFAWKLQRKVDDLFGEGAA